MVVCVGCGAAVESEVAELFGAGNEVCVRCCVANGHDHEDVSYGECELCDYVGADRSPEAFGVEVSEAVGAARLGCLPVGGAPELVGPFMVSWPLSPRLAVVVSPGAYSWVDAAVTLDGYEWETVEADTISAALSRALHALPTAAELAR